MKERDEVWWVGLDSGGGGVGRWEQRLGGCKMDYEVCIMQVSGHPSVNCAPHNRWLLA